MDPTVFLHAITEMILAIIAAIDCPEEDVVNAATDPSETNQVTVRWAARCCVLNDRDRFANRREARRYWRDRGDEVVATWWAQVGQRNRDDIVKQVRVARANRNA